MPVLRRCLLRAALSVVPLAAATPLAAQQPPAPQAREAGRPAFLLAVGVAGQRDRDRDLGPPGLTAALGLAWRAERTLGARLEAQVVGYPGQAIPAIVGARGSAERVGAVAALGQWRPSARARLYLRGRPDARGAERAIAVPPLSRREARAHRVVRGRYSAAPPLAVSRQEPSAPATAGGPRGASG